jgi:hypothetical protein
MHAPVRPRFIIPPFEDSAESGRLTLRDGTTAHVCPGRPDDREALARFFRELSAESHYWRFLSVSMPGPELIARLVSEGDQHSALTLVVNRVADGAARPVLPGCAGSGRTGIPVATYAAVS